MANACLGGYWVHWEVCSLDLGSIDFLGFLSVDVNLLRSLRFQFLWGSIGFYLDF